MGFDYEERTRDNYKSDELAENYHRAFSGARSWRALRFRLVASRERATIGRFLSRVPAESVLDIPAGTGKLAPVFQARGLAVTACDVSENMLRVARREYESRGYERVGFQVCDAAKIRETLDRDFDVAVCLRLLHRVPSDVTSAILAELAASAVHTIASFGVESAYQRARLFLRRRAFGGDAEELCFRTIPEIHALVAPHFDVLDSAWIVPFLSRERVFLLKSRCPASAGGE